MPEIADARALLEALAETGEVKSVEAQQQRRLHLHVAYGNALIAARGGGAQETTEAFTRARELALRCGDASERMAIHFGLWIGGYVRGELSSMRAEAAAFLSEVEARPDSPEAGVAHRVTGITQQFAGEYVEARDHLEKALALFRPGRDDELAFRFGQDAGISAMGNLAHVLWPLGEFDRAIALVDQMQTRIIGLTHARALSFARLHTALFELMRGDHSRAAHSAVELARLAREHELTMYRSFGVFLEGWTKAGDGTPGCGLEDMRRGVDLLREQNVLMFDGPIKIALAEAEAQAGDVDRAIAILDEALATADRLGYRAFEAELHRARGDTLLKRDPANPAPAEAAFLTAIAVAKQQGTRSFELRAALSLAKLYQSTARPADAHAVLAPALEGFSPTPEMPELSEAQALLAALAEMEEVKSAEAQRQRRLHLQTTYGQALMLSKGFAAEETKDAFARARELVGGKENPAERFPAYFAQWVRSLARGEHRRAQRVAETFLREAEEGGYATEAGFARRCLGASCCYQGKLLEAQTHLERALADYQPDRDAQTRFRFGFDTRILATANLVTTTWHLGQVERARQLAEQAVQSATELGHVPTSAFAMFFKTGLETLRNDPGAALRSAETLLALVREHGMEFFVGVGEAYAGWARGRLGDPQAGAQLIRRAWAEQFNETNRINAPSFHGLLAELEAATRGPDAALTLIDQGLAAAQETGEHYTDPYLHRLRGEVLFRRDPANPVPAEEAFQTAVAIAKQQGARSYELLASFSLAKLYQSTGRLAEAHAILAPALEGFSPTPEMPEIAEAQALLAALSQSDEVKAEAARRQRLTQLHVSYGNALIAARGFGAAETTEAFARARESASGDKDAPGRLSAVYGLWASSNQRGELPAMRAHAEAFLSEVEARPDSPEAGVAHRSAGNTCWFVGEYAQARDHLERALVLFEPGRDDDLAFRFGLDPGVGAMGFLAFALWPLGEVDRAISLIDRMQTRVACLTHVGTLAFGRYLAAPFHLMRGDHLRAAPNAFELASLARDHELTMYGAFGAFLEGWSTAAKGAFAEGLENMRRGVELLREQNVLLFDGLLKIALAKAEAGAGDPDRAIAILDEALATCDRMGYRAFEAELHRVRGEILLTRDPANSAPVEDAFLTAIAVAKQQGTRSFELRAALALAKLYQSTARPADAHAVLTPALKGFAPTSEFPEIEEALELVSTIEASAQSGRR